MARSLLPDATPFRAWTNFEFRDNSGTWHEVDLLLLGRRRLHLVELKYYHGTISGNDLTWSRPGRDAEDSPLKLAHRKAQRLATRLRELARSAHASLETKENPRGPRSVVPFVQEAVFLHHPRVQCRLPRGSRQDLFGLDNAKGTGIPGISRRLLEGSSGGNDIGADQEERIVALMNQLGAVERRPRAVGSWLIDGGPLGEGDGWQDSAGPEAGRQDRAGPDPLPYHPSGRHGRGRGDSVRLAEHEYQIMRRLRNDRLLCPCDIVDHELGVGLVYPLDERFQRLDLWLTDQAGSISVADRLALVRAIAETVGYAHENRVAHRGLTPYAVLVRPLPEGKWRILVGDWQSAGLSGPAMTAVPIPGVTKLIRPDEKAEAFQAPEEKWNASDRIRLDVFALGALAYFMLTGRPPAAGKTQLRGRLARDDGLDLRDDLPQVQPAVRALVLAATRPAVSERLPDVWSFIELLSAAEESARSPAGDVNDPLEASPRSVIDGRFRLERRLGAGSTAVGLLVTDLRQDEYRVLKVAVDDAAAARLASEASVLATLDHPRLVRLVEGPVEIGGRQALILEPPGNDTLAATLHLTPRLSPDLIRRWGTDLLEALVALDRAGVVHRDIKPANLGVRQYSQDQVDHLVLFDFSLTGAGAAAVTVGTPPYLDPFLGAPGRDKYDSAAERYSAAVVLFEMATGVIPRFGDGLSNPASVHDEAAIDSRMFDPAQAGALAAFFRTALARDSGQRHASARDMLSAWQAIFANSSVPVAPAETRADAALRLMSDAEALARAIDAGSPNTNFVREGVLSDISRRTGPRRSSPGRARRGRPRRRPGCRAGADRRDSGRNRPGPGRPVAYRCAGQPGRGYAVFPVAVS